MSDRERFKQLIAETSGKFDDNRRMAAGIVAANRSTVANAAHQAVAEMRQQIEMQRIMETRMQ